MSVLSHCVPHLGTFNRRTGNSCSVIPGSTHEGSPVVPLWLLPQWKITVKARDRTIWMTSCTIQVQTRGGVGMIVLGDCAYRVYTKKKKKHSKLFSFSGRPVLFQSCCLLPVVSVPFNSNNRKDESLGDVMVASMGFPPSSKLLLSLPDIGHTCSLALCCYIWAVIYSSAMEKQ